MQNKVGKPGSKKKHHYIYLKTNLTKIIVMLVAKSNFLVYMYNNMVLTSHFQSREIRECISTRSNEHAYILGYSFTNPII
jgi:hypothetical protein